jgi:DNA-binding transcriptional LysR family regulator
MIAVGVGPDLRMAVVASPAYLAAHPAPQTPQDLTLHRCVNQRMLASGQTYDWEFEQDGRALDIKVTGPLTYNEPELMLEAALDGLGLAYILEDHVSAYLAAGRLVRLLEDWTPPFPGYFLYYSSRRQQTTAAATGSDTKAAKARERRDAAFPEIKLGPSAAAGSAEAK